jgi:capsule polysaccharide export protein KpsE/RkpR
MSLGSLTSVAASLGIDGLSKNSNPDAIYSEIYPNVIQSKNFIAELMSVEVETKDTGIKCNYYTYLQDHQKAPWWGYVFNSIASVFGQHEEKFTYSGKEKLSVFNLSKEQTQLFQAVQGKIKCLVDKKTNIVSIKVEDQDPLVCATIAEATCKKLQNFIVEYRTNKARIDYEYHKKLCEESKKEYEEAVSKYAVSMDSYRDAGLATYKAKQQKLYNDMQLKHNVYSAMNTQMQSSMAKLQEATPAFTVIESASVPVKPAGPKRMIVSIFLTILAFIVLSGIILTRESK